MKAQETERLIVEERKSGSSISIVENVLEKRIDDIVTLLSSESYGKSRLYEDIQSIFDRILIKIALQRSNNIKSAAASFLGINRNTLHKKVEKLGIHIDKKKGEDEFL
jgi:DNA-binding NtrC family response regulator